MRADETPTTYRSGFVSLVGRPNVGKSTLLNALLNRKVAITSAKPQTTRNAIRGVLSGDGYQTRFAGVLKLPVTSFRYHQSPPIRFEHTDHFTYLHAGTISE